MNLLAKSCFSPGIISMISNLITSAGDMDLEQFKSEWMKEYVEGMGHEIYRTALSDKFQGKTFSEVAAEMYNEFQGIIFGIELNLGGKTIIKLNPGTFIIPQPENNNNVSVYVICESKKVADQITYYDMTSDEIAAYNNRIQEKTEQELDYSGIINKDKLDDEILKELQNTANEDADDELIGTDYILLQ